MEGGRREAEAGLETVKGREYGEKEKTREKKFFFLQMHGLVTRSNRLPNFYIIIYKDR